METRHIFIFLAQNPMYVGCNGATCVYASCLTVAIVYVQNLEFFYYGMNKKGKLEFEEGKGRSSKQDAWSVEKDTIIDAP